MSCGWSRTTITAVEGAEVAAGAGEEVAAHDARAGCRRAPAGGRRPTPSAVSGLGFAAMSAKRVLARSPARPLRSTGSRTTPTPTSRAPVGSSASSTASATSLGSPPRATIADPLALQPVAGQHRVDAVGELVGAAQLAVQLVGPRAGVLEVADEAALEVPAGVGQRVAAELGADQDPDRQREEDRDQRGGVVAGAVTHQRAKARSPRLRRGTTGRARS